MMQAQTPPAIPRSIDPRAHQAALELPAGATYQGLLETLASFGIDREEPSGAGGEVEGYARQDFERFVRTLSLVPSGPLDLLEIGANPYFTTYLLTRFRPQARLSLSNSFGGPQELRAQTVVARGPQGQTEKFVFEFTNTNLETMRLPYADASFDVVLFCEVIEHLIEDPCRALLEIKRVLRPSGLLILTTPNVARLENVMRMVAGANLYDPYSGHGVYGRHNREYSKHELWRLLGFCGFTVQQLFSADVHQNQAVSYGDVSRLESLLAFRAPDLGQYIFSTWRNDGPAPTKLPGWLYRSLPADRLDPTPL